MIVFTSDWHIADAALRRQPKMKGDALFSLAQIIRFCIANGAEALIGAGDLYDANSPSAAAQAAAHAELWKLPQNCRFLYIQGQHENDRAIPRLAAAGTGDHLSRKCVELDGGNLRVVGLDWTTIDNLPSAMANLPTADLLVMHQVWKEFMGDVKGVEGSIAELVKSPHLLTGDYHKHLTLQVGDTTVYSCGSLAMQAVDESPLKSFYVWDNGVVRDVSLVTRGFARYSISSAEALEEFHQIIVPWIDQEVARMVHSQAPVDLHKPYVYVDFNIDVPKAHATLTKLLQDRCHYDLMPIPSTTHIVVDYRSAGVRPTLSNLLDLSMPPNDPGYGLARRLLDSDLADASKILDAEEELTLCS